MDLELTNKRALVTGSTAGIGFGIAERLGREGARVVINGRTPARVEQALKALRDRVPAGRFEGVAADLSNEAGARTLTAAVDEVEILVNNAGAFTAKPFAELTTDDWLALYSTNVLSGVWLSKHYLPKMLARNWGRIVFISSESALQIPSEMIHYGVSKTAQAALARGLAELTKNTAVTVNSILAGPTLSEGVGRFVGELSSQTGTNPETVKKEFFATARPTSLLQRFATPEEIAQVVAFVASPLASVISGAAVRAEGGVLKSTF